MKKNLMILMLIGFFMGDVVGVYGTIVNEVATKDINNMDIEEIVTLLNSSDWRIQDVVIGKIEYGTPTLLNNEKIKLAIIRVLEKINANGEKLWAKWQEYYERTGQEPPPEWKLEGIITEDGYGEFQLYVVRIVEGFKDERALPALVGSIEGGGYRQIAEFGVIAVKPLLERLEKTKNYVTIYPSEVQ